MSDTVMLLRGWEMNSKKGSSAVFLTVILAALISIALALIYGLREETVKSRVDGILNLSGDSLLSEFDCLIQEEYGLFLLSQSDRELTEKLESYVTYAAEDMEDVDVEYLEASGDRFSISNIDLAREQILDYVKFAETQDILKSSPEKSEFKTNDMKNRVLRHGPTIASLPSSDIPGRSLTSLAESIADKAKDMDKAFESGSGEFLMNLYILNHFNNKNEAVCEKHFFKNEAEYILGGELSDIKNEKRVEMALKAMRFPLNLSHIYSDAEKRSAVMTAAEILTPGPEAIATQAVLASTWAYAEADNDVDLLWEGYKVPVMKDKSTWAIDLEGAIEGISGKTVVPDVQKGYDYRHYLQILLFFQDSGVKTARILDLIQINVRSSYDGDFLIQECSAGVEISAKVNGRVYGYEKKF